MDNIDNDFIFHWNNGNMISIIKTIIDKSVVTNNKIMNYKIRNKSDVSEVISILADDITICQSLHSINGFLQYISSNKNTIKGENMLADHEQFLNSQHGIYKKLLEIKKHELSHEDSQFIEALIKCYNKNGINLSEKNKILLKKVDTEIENIKSSIIKHIQHSENSIMTISYDKLNGMPLHIINTFENIDCDNVKIKLNKLNYNLCMSYIKKDKVRKDIEILYSNNKHSSIMEQIAKLVVYRDKHDKLLTFANHSEYILSNKMCSKSEYIQTFLKKMSEKLDINSNIYDTQYKLEQWKQTNGLNNDIVKEYFEVNDVIHKIIKIYELMFTVEFTKINNVSKWCNDMLVYNIKGNGVNGYLYLDLFNRDGKSKQIRCFCLQSSCMYPVISGKYIKPIVMLGASFNKYTNNTCLLNFDEVTSLFHEFGHVMHHIFGKTKYIIFSGMSVEDDFIETPAQILEQLCYEPYIIKYLSNHYCKKEKMSNNLIDKIIEFKNLENNFNYKKNILVAYFDQIIYSSSNFVKLCESSLVENKIDQIYIAFTLLYEQLNKEINDIQVSEILPHDFLQIICDLDSQYYTILWSKMTAIDLYNRNIKGENINANVGQKLIDCIFKFGGTKPALEMCALYMNNNISSSDNNSTNKPIIKVSKFNNKIKSNKMKHKSECIDSVSNNFCEIIDE
jgi:Zn-dependent oligopeptidase